MQEDVAAEEEGSEDAAEDPASEEPADEAAPAEDDVPSEYTSALNSAETYSEIMHMSKQGLFDRSPPSTPTSSPRRRPSTPSTTSRRTGTTMR